MNEMLLQKFIEIQANWTQASRENPEAQINPNAFLILEDCVDQTFRFDTVVEKVFYLGRHVKVACFVASQWCHALHPGVRSNADLVFIFQLHSVAERKHIWETYFVSCFFSSFLSPAKKFGGQKVGHLMGHLHGPLADL